jgi:hypothetical protein
MIRKPRSMKTSIPPALLAFGSNDGEIETARPVKKAI